MISIIWTIVIYSWKKTGKKKHLFITSLFYHSNCFFHSIFSSQKLYMPCNWLIIIEWSIDWSLEDRPIAATNKATCCFSQKKEKTTTSLLIHIENCEMKKKLRKTKIHFSSNVTCSFIHSFFFFENSTFNLFVNQTMWPKISIWFAR